MIYQEFAHFYDELFDEKLYDRWLNYTVKRIRSNWHVLDLACGTGRLAIRLAHRGYDIDGADLSENMLTMAEQRARTEHVNVPFIQADMRNLEGLPRYDAISCYDDSLCYLIEQSDLGRAFQSINDHLSPTGVFLFDVITPYQTDTVYPGFMYNYQDEGSAFMWTSYEGEFAAHSVEHELAFFLYNADKDAYDAYSELHQERTYDVETYKQMLANAGFSRILVTTDFGDRPFSNHVKRWMFECHKEIGLINAFSCWNCF